MPLVLHGCNFHKSNIVIKLKLADKLVIYFRFDISVSFYRCLQLVFALHIWNCAWLPSMFMCRWVVLILLCFMMSSSWIYYWIYLYVFCANRRCPCCNGNSYFLHSYYNKTWTTFPWMQVCEFKLYQYQTCVGRVAIHCRLNQRTH